MLKKHTSGWFRHLARKSLALDITAKISDKVLGLRMLDDCWDPWFDNLQHAGYLTGNYLSSVLSLSGWMAHIFCEYPSYFSWPWMWMAYFPQSLDTNRLFNLATRMFGVDSEAYEPGEREGGRVLLLLLTTVRFSPSATFTDPIQHPISPYPVTIAPMALKSIITKQSRLCVH